ncbi:MAG: DUF6438 domain-containing protein [Bacteroidota bacterium]
MRYTILLICALAFGLNACKSSQQMMYEAIPTDFTMTISRTPCMGTCPYYEVTVNADGSVKYIGKGHVKLMGEHSKQLPAETVVAIKEVIRSASFWELDESYDDPRISDLPSVSLSCTMDGRSHSVLARTGGPQEFGFMVRTLENLIGQDGYDPILE